MTKGGRIAGGVLAIVGGCLVLIAALNWFSIGGGALYPLAGIGAIAWGSLGLIGGILLIKDINAGGTLALIGGIGDILGIFVGAQGGFSTVFGLGFLLVDPFLILAGGIVGLAVGSEF